MACVLRQWIYYNMISFTPPILLLGMHTSSRGVARGVSGCPETPLACKVGRGKTKSLPLRAHVLPYIPCRIYNNVKTERTSRLLTLLILRTVLYPERPVSARSNNYCTHEIGPGVAVYTCAMLRRIVYRAVTIILFTFATSNHD